MTGLERITETCSTLTPEQLDLLDWIWQESIKLEHHEWISSVDVQYRLGGEEKGKAFLDAIGGIFIQEYDGHPASSYRLTAIGILACPSVQNLIPSIVALIKHIRTSVPPSDLPVDLPDDFVCNITGVSSDRVEELGLIFDIAHEIPVSIHRNKNGIWRIGKSRSLPALLEASSAESFLQDCLISERKDDRYVHIEERRKAGCQEVLVNKNDLRSDIQLLVAYMNRTQRRCDLFGKIIGWIVFGSPAFVAAFLAGYSIIDRNARTELLIAASAVTAVSILVGSLLKKGLGERRVEFMDRISQKCCMRMERRLLSKWREIGDPRDPLEIRGLKIDYF